MKKLKQTIELSVMILMLMCLVSCYSYGPIHEAYTMNEKITPPPPVQKKQAAPYTKAEYMQKTFTEIQNALPEADVRLIEDSIKVLFPNNIIYQRSEVYPSSDYQAPLLTFCQLLKRFNKTDILITGHTDSRGDKAKNRIISAQRAENIQTVIVMNDINKSRLHSMGLGDLSPIASNETDEGRAKNRRVEFVVLYRE